MKRKNKKEDLENQDSVETPRSLMVEKLIMEEMLNADDFNILLKTVQEEFERTFGLHSYEEENEFE